MHTVVLRIIIIIIIIIIVIIIIILILISNGYRKSAYVIRINCSNSCSVSPNPGRKHIKIEKI